MTAVTLSTSAAVVASASSSASTGKLVKLANGEYTASSVTADPTDAAKLALVKEKDGNYGTAKATDGTTAKVVTAASTATQTSSAGLSALTTLTLGGA